MGWLGLLVVLASGWWFDGYLRQKKGGEVRLELGDGLLEPGTPLPSLFFLVVVALPKEEEVVMCPSCSVFII